MSESERTAQGAADSIDPATLASWRRLNEAVTVLDVRDRDAFESWHITGPSVEALQTPHQQFIAARVQDTTEELVPDGSEPVVVVCAEGESSAEVAAQLRKAGIDARNLAGGMEAWATLYESVELPCSTGTVLQYRRPATGCLAYLVIGDSEGDDDRAAAVVDPLRAFAERYAADATDRGATLEYAIDTHVHADHVSGVRAVADETAAEVVLPAAVEESLPELDAEHDRSTVDDARVVEASEQLSLGATSLTARPLPGHTPGMTGFRLPDAEYGDLLFGGDTLFLTTVARPDLAVEAGRVEDLAAELHETLAGLRELPEETRTAPGHVAQSTQAREDGRYVATLGDLWERVDLLGLDKSAFVDRVTASLPERPANDREIRRINQGETAVEAETAFELELGPNNCAAE
jgi:glyoxylase-like metal-dependent hydrolase (beta-lactamase superfamily II)/rhodanese-related sulfurtransferase